ncbi:MAG: C39 family peptidase [Cyclobacteriaceae bacterium]
MSKRLSVDILPQPNDVTCGPTCLHAVYNYYGDDITLQEVVKGVKQLKLGGTLAVYLGIHAIEQGYKAKIYTYNLQVFDPTWFNLDRKSMRQKLKEQLEEKPTKRMQEATEAYLHFLNIGGTIAHDELTPALVRSSLLKGYPILTGLSATYLYQSAREIGETNAYDDIKGEPSGHFVVVSGYDKSNKEVLIADPLNPNPISDKEQYYHVDIQRLINAIMLGIVTYDANLLIIQPE